MGRQSPGRGGGPGATDAPAQSWAVWVPISGSGARKRTTAEGLPRRGWPAAVRGTAAGAQAGRRGGAWAGGRRPLRPAGRLSQVRRDGWCATRTREVGREATLPPQSGSGGPGLSHPRPPPQGEAVASLPERPPAKLGHRDQKTPLKQNRCLSGPFQAICRSVLCLQRLPRGPAHPRRRQEMAPVSTECQGRLTRSAPCERPARGAVRAPWGCGLSGGPSLPWGRAAAGGAALQCLRVLPELVPLRAAPALVRGADRGVGGLPVSASECPLPSGRHKAPG
jgi:hypothetical protein